VWMMIQVVPGAFATGCDTVLSFRAKIIGTVRILMIAPEPFFEPRGTPFSEFHRIRALTALGHQVDLVTYPFGQDVSMPGLRLFRSLRPPWVRGVKIGPSLAKIPLDALLTLTAIRRAFGGGYDAIHSHEEGGLIGVVLATMLGVPHLYDMHSSLPQQLSNFDFSSSKPLVWGMGLVERLLVRRSRVVIVICQQLANNAGELYVLTLDPSIEHTLASSIRGADAKSTLVLEPRFAEALERLEREPRATCAAHLADHIHAVRTEAQRGQQASGGDLRVQLGIAAAVLDAKDLPLGQLAVEFRCGAAHRFHDQAALHRRGFTEHSRVQGIQIEPRLRNGRRCYGHRRRFGARRRPPHRRCAPASGRPCRANP